MTYYYADYISGFAVPGFFVMSAMKFYRNYNLSMTQKKLKTRIYSLLVPYLLWNFLSVVWAIIFSYVPVLSNMVQQREKFIFSFECVIGGLFWFKFIHPFWYMALLMIFVLFCPIIYIIVKNKYIGFIVAFGLYIIDALNINFPKIGWPMFNIRTLIYCSSFYILGATLGKHYFNKIMKSPSSKHFIVAIILFIMAVSIRSISNNCNVVFIPAILIGLYAIWIISGLIKCKGSDILYTSFFVYPAHTFILPCVNKILYLLLPNNSISCIVNTVGGTVLTYLICILTGCFIKKNFPTIWNIFNGNRKTIRSNI